MDEEGCKEEDTKDYTKLVEQSEHIQDPAKKEIKLINVCIKQDKRELKIRMLIIIDMRNGLDAVL